MFKAINEENVLHIIRNKDQILSRINDAEILIRRQIMDEVALIEEASYPNPSAGFSSAMVQASPRNRDLFDTLEKFREVSAKMEKSLRVQLVDLIVEKETVLRVWACFCAIKDTGKYYDVLYENIINDEKLSSLSVKYKRSSKQIREWKKTALNIILLIYYNEDITVDDLSRLRISSLDVRSLEA